MKNFLKSSYLKLTYHNSRFHIPKLNSNKISGQYKSFKSCLNYLNEIVNTINKSNNKKTNSLSQNDI